MHNNNDLPPEVYALWDQMSEYDAADGDQGIHHLLDSICSMVDACNAIWMPTIRVQDVAECDPVNGWRPHVRRYLHDSDSVMTASAEQMKMLDAGVVDITTVRNIALVGDYRANRLIDLVEPEWFQGDYYRCFYHDIGFGDAIWLGCPINVDAEIFFGIYRSVSQPRFTPEDRDLMLTVQRGLRWFHRRQFLNLGLLVAEKPLTPAERRIVRELLAGLTEKQIANSQELSPHTVHDYVRNVYRKFGVRSRAELTALWLGNPPSDS